VQKTLRNSSGITFSGGTNGGGVGKNYVFRLVDKSLVRHLNAKNACPSTMVVHIHNSALAEEYAVSSAVVVVVEDC